jgi:acetylornithine deacetylase/succinyl-diaminopimelate desuccinylase-like protein
MMMAHMDVVGVERERWTTNPFGGEILDGYLYGRGAIDDKGMLAVNLQTMLLLNEHVVRAGGKLNRDVIFLATSDEEASGEFGIDWVLTRHPQLIQAEFALNEGGRLRESNGKLSYAAVQCGEKVANVLRLTASGTPGHASIPIPGNAVVRLARAVVAAAAHHEPVVLTPISTRFFAGLADFWPDRKVAPRWPTSRQVTPRGWRQAPRRSKRTRVSTRCFVTASRPRCSRRVCARMSSPLRRPPP